MGQLGRLAHAPLARRTAGFRLAVTTLALVAATIAGCSTSSGTTGQAANNPPATGAGGAAVVMAHSGPLGQYLTDASGKTLYLFAADTGTTSTCTGTCAVFWPPFTTTGTPTVGSGAQASLLTTSKRADGSMQVDYNGHPLYYYKADNAAGDATGQGLNLSGGLWWVVSPAGDAITTAAGPSASSSGH